MGPSCVPLTWDLILGNLQVKLAITGWSGTRGVLSTPREILGSPHLPILRKFHFGVIAKIESHPGTATTKDTGRYIQQHYSYYPLVVGRRDRLIDTLCICILFLFFPLWF